MVEPLTLAWFATAALGGVIGGRSDEYFCKRAPLQVPGAENGQKRPQKAESDDSLADHGDTFSPQFWYKSDSPSNKAV